MQDALGVKLGPGLRPDVEIRSRKELSSRFGRRERAPPRRRGEGVGSTRRVLVVEDNAMNLDLVREILSDEGYIDWAMVVG